MEQRSLETYNSVIAYFHKKEIIITENVYRKT